MYIVPLNFLFATKTEIVLSFYSNFSHFAYTAKLGLAPYIRRTYAVHTPYMRRLTFCYFRFTGRYPADNKNEVFQDFVQNDTTESQLM